MVQSIEIIDYLDKDSMKLSFKRYDTLVNLVETETIPILKSIVGDIFRLIDKFVAEMPKYQLENKDLGKQIVEYLPPTFLNKVTGERHILFETKLQVSKN
jgi:hypothetical protein